MPAAPPPTPPPLPTEPRSYIHFLRTPRARWWKGVLAIVAYIVAFLVLAFVIGGIGPIIDIATGRTTLEDLQAGRFEVTPWVFLTNNLALAALIPVSMWLQWAFFGQRPRWLSSVAGRFRWGWMGRAALIVVPVWLAYVGLTIALDPSAFTGLSPDWLFLLIAVLLTTPLQSAGEEYGHRGLLQRAGGSWFANEKVAFLVGSLVANLVFMVAHFAADPWLNAYYLVFGFALSYTVWRTGGLEAAVLIHACNNLFLLLPSVVFSDISGAFERDAGAGSPVMLLPMAIMVVTALVLSWWARRNRVEVTAAPAGAAAPPE